MLGGKPTEEFVTQFVGSVVSFCDVIGLFLFFFVGILQEISAKRNSTRHSVNIFFMLEVIEERKYFPERLIARKLKHKYHKTNVYGINECTNCNKLRKDSRCHSERSEESIRKFYNNRTWILQSLRSFRMTDQIAPLLAVGNHTFIPFLVRMGKKKITAALPSSASALRRWR